MLTARTGCTCFVPVWQGGGKERSGVCSEGHASALVPGPSPRRGKWIARSGETEGVKARSAFGFGRSPTPPRIRAVPLAHQGRGPGCFTSCSSTGFHLGGMRGVREAGACRAGVFFKSVCDRRWPPARGDFPDALAPVSNPAGIRVGRLVPSDRAGRPAGAQDVTPSRGQAPHTSGHKGLSSRLSSRKSRRSLSQVFRVGISSLLSACADIPSPGACAPPSSRQTVPRTVFGLFSPQGEREFPIELYVLLLPSREKVPRRSG